MNLKKLKTCTVVGAGTMGSCIASDFARTGRKVFLYDVSDEALCRGKDLLVSTMDTLVQEKVIARSAAKNVLHLVEFTRDLEGACGDTDLVVEAAPEKLDLKRSLFKEFDALCPKRTVLATNTSGLSISRIAAATRRPEKVAGMQYWNPPHIVPLVEITRGKCTTDSTVRFLSELCRATGKKPIVVKRDVPGCVGNRLQFAVFREALHILSEGIASAEDIDTAMVYGPGLRYALMGPLRTADLGGLDVFNAISEYLFKELNSSPRSPAVLAKMVRTGKLGEKTGEGFYSYTPTDRRRIVEERDRLLLKLLKTLNKGRSVL